MKSLLGLNFPRRSLIWWSGLIVLCGLVFAWVGGSFVMFWVRQAREGDWRVLRDGYVNGGQAGLGGFAAVIHTDGSAEVVDEAFRKRHRAPGIESPDAEDTGLHALVQSPEDRKAIEREEANAGPRVVKFGGFWDERSYGRWAMTSSEIKATITFKALAGPAQITEEEKKTILALAESQLDPNPKYRLWSFAFGRAMTGIEFLRASPRHETIVHWNGVAVDAASLVTACGFVWGVIGMGRELVRRRRENGEPGPRCVGCGYCLSGLGAAAVCPECGEMAATQHCPVFVR